MTVKFTTQHEYLRVDGTIGTVGITRYAQEQLGDVVFVDLPEIGRTLRQGDEAAVVESVKAASEIYAPASGTVTEINAALSADPSLVNTAAEGEGWMFRIALSDPGEIASLLDADAYSELTA